MWKLASALVAVGVVAYGCGDSDQHQAHRDSGGAAGEAGGRDAGAPGSTGKGGDATGGESGSASGAAGSLGVGGAGNAAGAPAAVGGANTSGANTSGADPGGADAGGAGPVVLPDALIVNLPYTCDSPFDGVVFPLYHYLEDFEDAVLSTPGASASSTLSSRTFSNSSLVDSVDCDDGTVDGSCSGCDALFSASGAIDVTFDAQVLGALPSHVGLVWTDGGLNCDVTVTGYDATDTLVYTETVSGIGDNSNYGETAEDRFFGIVHYAGVKRIHLANTGGGIEIDHLQYGR